MRKFIVKRQQIVASRNAGWELEDLRYLGGITKSGSFTECLRARRLFQRLSFRLGEEASRDHQARWKGFRKFLASAIKVTKQKSWADLIVSVDNDLWSKTYRIVMKRLRRPKVIPGIELPGRMEHIVDTIFPLAQPPVYDNHTRIDSTDQVPGPDRLLNEIIKVMVSCDPRRFHWLFNKCTSEGRIPANWKKGRLVLIPKLGIPLDSPLAYRPICLLDGCGKLLEKLIVSRLRKHLINDHCRKSVRFRRGRSTSDTWEDTQYTTPGHVYHHRFLDMLTLDVRNTFNLALWTVILEAIRAKNVQTSLRPAIEAYLSDITIIVSSPSGSTRCNLVEFYRARC